MRRVGYEDPTTISLILGLFFPIFRFLLRPVTNTGENNDTQKHTYNDRRNASRKNKQIDGTERCRSDRKDRIFQSRELSQGPYRAVYDRRS